MSFRTAPCTAAPHRRSWKECARSTSAATARQARPASPTQGPAANGRHQHPAAKHTTHPHLACSTSTKSLAAASCSSSKLDSDKALHSTPALFRVDCLNAHRNSAYSYSVLALLGSSDRLNEYLHSDEGRDQHEATIGDGASQEFDVATRGGPVALAGQAAQARNGPDPAHVHGCRVLQQRPNVSAATTTSSNRRTCSNASRMNRLLAR